MNSNLLLIALGAVFAVVIAMISIIALEEAGKINQQRSRNLAGIIMVACLVAIIPVVGFGSDAPSIITAS